MMQDALVTCRHGLEKVVAAELQELGVESIRPGTRCVYFRADTAGLYRCNMALRAALSVLVPIREFNARNYDMLYFQSRKTNWHKLFDVSKSLRIDVNGGSSQLRNTQYVVHRVKDGIVDTFRKLTEGSRPSVSKGEPDVHVVVHLDGSRVTLCLDLSGQPLFKRGYRTRHGGAPLKEDLAAGMLQMVRWDARQTLVDPMCGSGTFLFEAWMLAAGIAPNIDRGFAFEHLFDYDPELHAQEKERLRARESRELGEATFAGIDLDPESISIAEDIRSQHFPDAPIRFTCADFRDALPREAPLPRLICNPPYGLRKGEAGDMRPLYEALGKHLQSCLQGGTAGVYTAHPKAIEWMGVSPVKRFTLFNGQLEGELAVIRPS